MSIQFALCVHAAPIAVALRPSVQAAGSDWSLADAIDVPEAYRSLLQIDRLHVPSPRPGCVERLRRPQIERLLRAKARLALPELVWTGAEQVLVSRRTQSVASDEFLRVAIAAWRAARTELPEDSIEPLSQYEPLEIGLGRYQLRPRSIAEPGRAEVSVWVDVLQQDRVVRTVNIGLRNRLPRIIYQANRFLAAGEYVRAADFAKIETTGAAVETNVVPDAVGRARLRHALRQGEALTTGALEAEGAVRRGDQVQVVTHAGDLTLEATSTVAVDALPGQVVAVHWAAGKELVRGRLHAGHKVEIE